MARFLRSIIFFGWCVHAILLAGLGGALAQPVRTTLSPGIPVIEIEGFGFPRQIAGMERGYKTDFRVPGLGFSVLYGTPGEIWADIFIYDKELDLRSDSPLTLAREELEAALGDVMVLMKAGNYQSAKIERRSVSGAFATAHLTIMQAGKAYGSFTFVTVHNGKFVKIRLTSRSKADAQRLAESFLSEFSQVLGKPI